MSCSDCTIPEIGSADFLDELARRPAGEDTLPMSGSIELTLRCNLRCRHCYIHAPGAADGEMDTARARKVLDALADAGVLSLLVTGGEIFLRRDFREIYLHARRRGFLMTLFTNATRVDDGLADFLAAQPPRRIEISIYGHTAETYERITGGPGSFAAFRRGLDRLVARDLPVYLKSMVLRSNVHEFAAMKAWAESLGRPFRYDAIVNARLDGGTEPFAERLPPEEAARWQVEADAEPRSPAEWRGKTEGWGPDPRLFRCGAGRVTFHVDPRGMLHPCLMWRRDPYDLLDGSVAGWRRHMAELLRRRAPADSECASCLDRTMCLNCAATSAHEASAPGLPAAYYCAVCRARATRRPSAGK
ncbi:MAG TPA: radical SAM protein [Kiritimatiellia bacterium]|nr:radical SAM protein [Kiritimatiellia bacterium]HRZ13370.1 radical SAM protein [Kiritimatiellia bacterium]HSA18990.1 radical SAM protein [Kiritimatiellia bacterium]